MICLIIWMSVASNIKIEEVGPYLIELTNGSTASRQKAARDHFVHAPLTNSTILLRSAAVTSSCVGNVISRSAARLRRRKTLSLQTSLPAPRSRSPAPDTAPRCRVLLPVKQQRPCPGSSRSGSSTGNRRQARPRCGNSGEAKLGGKGRGVLGPFPVRCLQPLLRQCRSSPACSPEPASRRKVSIEERLSQLQERQPCRKPVEPGPDEERQERRFRQFPKLCRQCPAAEAMHAPVLRPRRSVVSSLR